MRRVVTHTDEFHPDVPRPAAADLQRPVWMVYLDGKPFIGTTEIYKATEYQAKLVAGGKHEYVDIALAEDRRTNTTNPFRGLPGCDNREDD